MARDLLCAALSLPGCEQSPRAVRATAACSWRMPRFVTRPVARRRLLVLVNDRTGMFEQPAHDPRAKQAETKWRLWFVCFTSGP